MKLIKHVTSATIPVLSLVAIALLLGWQLAAASGTQTAPAGEKGKSASAGHPMKASATIESRTGSKVTGAATFMARKGKVTLRLSIAGAEPGMHAVHIHEKGDCSAQDATSAGGHWNPTSENHGKWAIAPFHHGDIGNVEVGANGKGKLVLTTDLWSIGGDPGNDILGKAIIVHAKVDDFTTQPTGNAGGRVGCGVITAAGK